MAKTRQTIRLPKETFTRAKEEDFSDDGTRFLVYYYKDIMRVSYARWNKPNNGGTMVFFNPRCHVSYDKLPKEERRRMYLIESEFNGVDINEFDMDKFVANCEELVSKYHTCPWFK